MAPKTPADDERTRAIKAATDLIAYFRPQRRRGPEFVKGAELAERWLALIKNPSPTEGEIRALLRELAEGERDGGSGWFDLSARASAWARRRR